MNQQVIDELTALLGREPTCTKVKDGKYLAEYVKLGAPLTKLVADTEDEALSNLLNYLKSNNVKN